ncbi:hypothetical protein B0H14DRAFT_3529336 [Mycena olivaceomarginata]|nr:hypothetical protein B0H14DRAFT_3529336 [Mycena olivaceomarginata]
MAVPCSLSVLRFIANMGSMTLLLHYARVSILLEWRWLVWTALSFGLAVDMLIMVSMCYFLQKMRWSTESTRWFTTRTDLVWATFFIIQAKLFSNSMLASLNGRARFRAFAGADDEPFEMLHFVSFGPEASKAGMVRDSQISPCSSFSYSSLMPGLVSPGRRLALAGRRERLQDGRFIGAREEVPAVFWGGWLCGYYPSDSCISDIRFLPVERSTPANETSAV